MGQCCSQPDTITAADSVSNDVSIAGNNQFRITLYAVRHGEAVHNVKEKEAKMTAEASLRASTENPSPEAIKEAIEQERQKVLRLAALLPQKFLSELHHHSRQPKGEHRE